MADDPALAEMTAYYRHRAREYDEIYQIPRRQSDIDKLRADISHRFSARRVLEIACGSGYWTQLIANRAHAITAVDINQSMLDLAAARAYPDTCAIDFQRDDVLTLDAVTDNKFDACFAGFWLSHVRKQQLSAFITLLHSRLVSGSPVLFLDNRYIADSTPIHRYDAHGNGYQKRSLNDGREFEIVKNFPTQQQLTTLLGTRAHNLTYTESTFFWTLDYLLV